MFYALLKSMEPWTNLPEYESQSDDILDCLCYFHIWPSINEVDEYIIRN